MAMDRLLNLDAGISVAINSAHTPFLDAIMVFVSKIWVWVPLYLFVLAYIILLNRKNWKTILLYVAGLALTLLLTDQISCFVKDSVCRFRPCHDPSLEGIVRVIVSKGSKYGFFSSHAANVFGFAFLSSRILKKNWYTIFIFIWAAIISYSRIYLAKHFFGDVICGTLFGVAIAAIVNVILQRIVLQLKS